MLLKINLYFFIFKYNNIKLNTYFKLTKFIYYLQIHKFKNLNIMFKSVNKIKQSIFIFKHLIINNFLFINKYIEYILNYKIYLYIYFNILKFFSLYDVLIINLIKQQLNLKFKFFLYKLIIKLKHYLLGYLYFYKYKQIYILQEILIFFFKNSKLSIHKKFFSFIYFLFKIFFLLLKKKYKLCGLLIKCRGKLGVSGIHRTIIKNHILGTFQLKSKLNYLTHKHINL